MERGNSNAEGGANGEHGQGGSRTPSASGSGTLPGSSGGASAQGAVGDNSMAGAPPPTGSERMSLNNIPVFLEKLFTMIESASNDVVSWSEAGDSFIIKQV